MKKLMVMLMIIGMGIFLYGEKLTELSELTNPSMIKCDGKQFYILDGYQVFIYSMEDFKMLGQFGKKGEGPGELLTQPDLPLVMEVTADHVILNSFNKVVYFTKMGRYVKEIRIPFLAFQVLEFGNNFVATRFNRASDGSGSLYVDVYDQNMKKIKSLYSTSLLNDQGKGKIAFPLLNVLLRRSGDRLYLVDQLKNFQVEIYNLKGEKIQVIKQDYQKIRIDKAYIKEKTDWMKKQPAFKTAPDRIRRMVYFLDYLPAIDNILLSDEILYLRTSRIQDGKVEFISFDEEGKFKEKKLLPDAKIDAIRPIPITNYFFHGNKYYYLVDVDETWELHNK